ncbi:hypothetical protein GCM10020229_31840 [Kitasatospora albolonga]
MGGPPADGRGIAGSVGDGPPPPEGGPEYGPVGSDGGWELTSCLQGLRFCLPPPLILDPPTPPVAPTTAVRGDPGGPVPPGVTASGSPTVRARPKLR